MRTVWAEFLVPDDATPETVAQALEIVFRAPTASATASGSQRRAIEALRTVPPRGTTLADLRLQAADTVHLCFEYGRDVASASDWTAGPDRLDRAVSLRDDDGSPVAAVLEVAFEPGTAIVLSARAVGEDLDEEGRRLDPLVVDTDDLARARLAAAERALGAIAGGPAAVGPWYGVPEAGMVALARDLLLAGEPLRLVVSFAPGSSRPSSTRREAPSARNTR